MKMKKLFAVLLAATALTAGLMLTACGGSDPEAEIQADLAAQFDPIVAAEESAVEEIASGMGSATSQLATYGISADEFVLSMIDGLEYEISSITVDGETATAEVIVTCKSFNETTELIEQISEDFVNSNDVSGMTTSEIEQKTGEIMMQAMDQTSLRETTCTFNYELVDGTWTMTADGATEIANAFLS